MWYSCGPGSSDGIATNYGLDGLGNESRWGRNWSHSSRQDLWPTQPPVQWVPGVMRPGRGADNPSPSNAEVENELGYSSTHTLGRWFPVIGWPLSLSYVIYLCSVWTCPETSVTNCQSTLRNITVKRRTWYSSLESLAELWTLNNRII
jgi:hypothetical protein